MRRVINFLLGERLRQAGMVQRIAAFGILVFFSCCLEMMGTAVAFETWVIDQKTGYKLAWVSNTHKVIAGSWSGRAVKGKAQGKGILEVTLQDMAGGQLKVRASGAMVAGKLDGNVLVQWSNGQSYDGSYRGGVREGAGRFKMADGAEYVGEWRSDMMNGSGTFSYPNGNKYIGEMKDNYFDGRGTYNWNDGSNYVGDWRGGAREGVGVLRWPNGQMYSGEFENNQRDGRGALVFPNGITYIGQFQRSRMNGRGMLKGPMGDVLFSGEWMDGEDGSLTYF